MRDSSRASDFQCSATFSYALWMDGSVACAARRLASSAFRRQVSVSDDIRGGSSNAPNQAAGSQCKPFIGLPGSIFAEVLERRLKRIAELEATPINASKPEIEVKPPMPRLADRRYRRFLNRKPMVRGLAFGSATFLGGGRFMNSKILQLCSCFQLLSQPNGLCSSSCPCVPCSVAIFDWNFPTFKPASPVSAAKLRKFIP